MSKQPRISNERELPSDVLQFLLDHPDEVQHVRYRMKDMEERMMRPIREEEERKRRAALPLKKCTALPYTNCQNMTPGGYICDDCAAEYREDPDAFK